MKSLKMVIEQPKTMVGEPKEAYPYGMVLRLEKAQIDALEMKELPEVGVEVEFEAKAKVVKVEKREDYVCVELQVTDMEVEGKSEETPEAEGEGQADGKSVEGKSYGEKFYGYMG